MQHTAADSGRRIGTVREDTGQGADCYEMQKLGKANLVYVVSLVRQYKNQGLELEELIEAGKEGVRRAARTYRSDSDISFRKYAVGQMRQCIQTAIELKK